MADVWGPPFSPLQRHLLPLMPLPSPVLCPDSVPSGGQHGHVGFLSENALAVRMAGAGQHSPQVPEHPLTPGWCALWHEAEPALCLRPGFYPEKHTTHISERPYSLSTLTRVIWKNILLFPAVFSLPRLTVSATNDSGEYSVTQTPNSPPWSPHARLLPWVP